MNLPIIWFLSGLLFAGLLISLGFQPKFMNRLLGVIFLFVGLAGLCFYGYGYYELHGGSLFTIAKTVFWVFCMFLGRNDIGTISKVPFLAQNGIQIFIYLTHLMALYATASTVVTNVGARLIRSLNLLLLHHKKINVIFGVHEEVMDFAAKLQQYDKGVLVFIDDGSASAFNSRILKMGGILMSDAAAKDPSPAFLKKIGMKPGKKELSLYCLSEDLTANLRYAEGMKQVLEEKQILPEQCSITLLTGDERAGSVLQADRNGYGFGSVLAMEKEELMARLLIQQFPPYETMRFQAHGLADEDFETLVVGFGRSGQAVLKQLLMNGQFAGSCFHARIVSKDHTRESGHFVSRYAGVMAHYDLDFIEQNVRSLGVYDYLKQHINEINYIVICTGNEADNAEIGQEIRDFLEDHGGRACVLLCTRSSITSYQADDGMPRRLSIYSPDILCGNHLDEMAMRINHSYHLADGNDIKTDWASCDYFSRQSCRASADYSGAFLAAAGLTTEELIQNGWPDDPELMEHLGEMEHLRWCAFHYCMGYDTMPEETFAERAEAYLAEKKAKGESRIRVGKDTEHKLHACLIPWEELPLLDQKEKNLTGRDVNYQQMDLDNVLLIPELLKSRSSEPV